jgi:glutamyl-tRNA(Gln) amidotransferase subunit D
MAVMHAETDDSFLYAHRGTRVRKSHTSRRDAFQSINTYPLFKIQNNEASEISSPVFRRNPEKKLKLKANFEEKVALVKTYPGISDEIIDYYVKNEYKGIIVEGTGLGHTPDRFKTPLRKALDQGIIVGMTSQCISGRVDMNVYRSGVELLDMGVISCEDMIAETALVKLMWILANVTNPEKAKEMLSKSLVGEIGMRSENAEYHPTQGDN